MPGFFSSSQGDTDHGRSCALIRASAQNKAATASSKSAPLAAADDLRAIESSLRERTLLVRSVHLAQGIADFADRGVGFHRIDNERHRVHGRYLAVGSGLRILRRSFL